MSVFKDYNGNVLKIDHTHKVADTQGTRTIPTSVGPDELLDKSSISLKYYSTTLTPIVTTETVGSVQVLNISVNNNTDLNGNLVLKINTCTEDLEAPSVASDIFYVLIIEPLEDSVSKTSLIDFDCCPNKPFDYERNSYIYDEIANGSNIGYSSNGYIYRIIDDSAINSIMINLYSIMKGSGSVKKLVRISLRELTYGSKNSIAFVDENNIGFMSPEDKIKLEQTDAIVELAENKLQNALFYSDEIMDIINMPR